MALGWNPIHGSGHSSWIRFISVLTPLIFPPGFKLLVPRGYIFSLQFSRVLRAFNVHHLPRAYKELGIVPWTCGGQNNGPLTNVNVLVFWNPWIHYGRWQRDSADVIKVKILAIGRLSLSRGALTITGVLKNQRTFPGCREERDISVKRPWPTTAGSEDGKFLLTKKC